MRGDNDNPDGVGQVFGPSLAMLLLPSAVIGAGYLALFLWLALSERSAGPIGRLCLVVLSLGVPFLVAHAVLRAATIRLRVLPHALLVQQGFPRAGSQEIPYAMIRGATVRRRSPGWLAPGGTLAITLADGSAVALADLARPEDALAAIEARIAREDPKTSSEPRFAVTSAHF